MLNQQAVFIMLSCCWFLIHDSTRNICYRLDQLYQVLQPCLRHMCPVPRGSGLNISSSCPARFSFRDSRSFTRAAAGQIAFGDGTFASASEASIAHRFAETVSLVDRQKSATLFGHRSQGRHAVGCRQNSSPIKPCSLSSRQSA